MEYAVYVPNPEVRRVYWYKRSKQIKGKFESQTFGYLVLASSGDLSAHAAIVAVLKSPSVSSKLLASRSIISSYIELVVYRLQWKLVLLCKWIKAAWHLVKVGTSLEMTNCASLNMVNTKMIFMNSKVHSNCISEKRWMRPYVSSDLPH